MLLNNYFKYGRITNMSKKIITEKDIDNLIVNDQTDYNKMNEGILSQSQKCPNCGGIDLQVLHIDDIFITFECKNCKKKFTGLDKDHNLLI